MGPHGPHGGPGGWDLAYLGIVLDLSWAYLGPSLVDPLLCGPLKDPYGPLLVTHARDTHKRCPALCARGQQPLWRSTLALLGTA